MRNNGAASKLKVPATISWLLPIILSLVFIFLAIDRLYAWDYVYDHEREDDPTAYVYPPDGEIRAKFVFVTFPDFSPVLTYVEHGIYVDLFRDYFAKHSNE